MLIYHLFFVFILLGLPGRSDLGALSINLEGVRSTKGKLHIAIYDNAESFPKEGQFLMKKQLPADQRLVIIDNLKFGEYAIAVYHDENNNGKLDKNFLGIPTEPYAFSNDLKPKWKRPTYEEAVITFNKDQLALQLTLHKWKEL